MSIKRALLSVSDKAGIVEFAQSLANLGYELISTGGTKKAIFDAGIAVKDISEITEFPEMMDGRVKTLHPKVHGGLLSIRGNADHTKAMVDNGIEYIDLVCVNLYPFKETISKPGVTYQDAIENIDIGGPSMLRSAAKNHAFVTVVTDPTDYAVVIEEIKESGDTTFETRQRLALKVFQTTAAYDALIADYFARTLGDAFPEKLTLTFEKQQALRYGENPHQAAAFYRTPLAESNALAYAKQLHGKELSYNNIQDGNAAVNIMLEYKEPVVVAVKHMNPCGVGTGSTLFEAWTKAFEADSTSIFGGIIATNQVVDAQTATEMSKIFLEIIIAPAFTSEAREILEAKKNIRLLENPAMVSELDGEYTTTAVNGGLLVQTKDRGAINFDDFEIVTERAPTNEEKEALLFAWKVVKHVKSNAIVVAKAGQTLGIGAGQMNRVGAAKIALEQAGSEAEGNVLASDAFFPMADTLEIAAKAGIKAIIQPGGSIKDQDSIDVANQYGIAMVFTKKRHFKH